MPQLHIFNVPECDKFALGILRNTEGNFGGQS